MGSLSPDASKSAPEARAGPAEEPAVPPPGDETAAGRGPDGLLGGAETLPLPRPAAAAVPADALSAFDTIPAKRVPPREPARRPAEAAAEPIERLGDFDLLAILGRGSMGVVYRARQRSLDRIVALKVLTAGHAATAAGSQRFIREASAAARLQHPGIVPVHSIGYEGGRHFFAMDLIDGESLAAVVARGPLAPRRALEIAAEIADALAYAHARGVIHRDIKPANVMIERGGRPRLTDFGLAKILGGTELTESGSTLGTPAYMPPEQARGESGRVDARSDVYSLGAVLYELLTGRAPFRSATVLETLAQVVERDPLPPKTLRRSLHRDIETICLRCLAKDPARRYESAAALGADIRRHLGGETILARPVGPLARAGRKVKRYKAIVIVGLAAAVAIGATAGYFLREASRRAEADRQATAERVAAQHREAERLTGEARAAFEAGRLEEALDRAGGALALERERPDAEVILEMARRGIEDRRARAAETAGKEALEKARAGRRGEADEAASAAAAEARAGRYREAFLGFERAMAIDPGHAAAEEGRRRALLGEVSEALARKQVDLARDRLETARAIGIPESETAPLEIEIRRLSGQRDRFREVLLAAETLLEARDARGALARLGEARALALADDERRVIEAREAHARAVGLAAALERARAARDDRARVAAYEEALEFEPGHPEAARARAEARARLAAPAGLVFVPACRTRVGSADPAAGNPLREVDVAAFYAAQHEVTNAEYHRFLRSERARDPALFGEDGARCLDAFVERPGGRPGPLGWCEGTYPPGAGDRPVTGVSFFEARACARFLGARLPRDVEWEIAAGFDPARGAVRAYPWGEEYDRSAGAFLLEAPAPVGGARRDRSPLGLYDCGGNAQEWTEGEGGEPVLRGGSYRYPSEDYARTSWRRPMRGDYRTEATGFRLARDIGGEAAR